MQLSPAQWATIRRIAAEQARQVINSEHNVNPAWQEALNFGFDPSQLTEVSRIAGCTARKQIEQHRSLEKDHQRLYHLNQELSARNDALTSQIQQLQEGAQTLDSVLGIRTEENHELCKKLDSAVAQNVALHNELRVCREQRAIERKDAAELRAQLGGIVAENRGKLRIKIACDLSPDSRAAFPGLEEGDRWLNTANGEIFTFFMGQWRRRSELEGFASAKKYL